MSTRSWPTAELTRHFFREFFYVGFLTDLGADSFLRVMISLLAGVLSLGLLVPIVFFRKYVDLAALPRPEAYRRAVLGDQLFMLCVAMFILALVAAVICQSLFPSETDFRILVPLPVTRRAVFGAKLLALAIVTSTFVFATNLAIGPVFPAISGGRWAQAPLESRLMAHTTSSLLASIFAVSSVLSTQGLIAVFVPRRWLRLASVTAQTLTVSGLMLALPFITRAPAQGALIQSHPGWLYATPPGWFLGLEQVLLGSRDVYFLRLFWIGIAASAFCAASTGACYLILYRRFDQVVLRASPSLSSPRTAWLRRLSAIGRLHPAQAAMVEFIAAALGRSRLHQLVFAGTSACALAIAANSLLAVGIVELFVGQGERSRVLLLFADWTPLLVIFVAVRVLRDTLRLPLEIRANWIFKMTEDDAVRGHQLDAVRLVLFFLGVIPAATLFFPVQILAFGGLRACCWMVLTLLIGRVLVDCTLIGWRSIPFTCAYAPGKRHVIPTILMTLAAFFAFIAIGSASVRSGTAGPSSFIVWLGIFSGAIAGVRRYRLRALGRLPLEFEDIPDDLQLLQLTPR